jgi:hypothetical protein
MRKILFIALLSISSATLAKDMCSFTWELKSRGISIGKMHDVIIQDGNYSEVVSTSTPSTVAAIFNVKKVVRTVKFQNKLLNSRIEDIHGSNRKVISWNKDSSDIWKQSINGVEGDKLENEKNYTYIDSTSLPYLISIDALSEQSTTNNVVIINKSLPYHAQVSVENITDDPIKKTKVLFKTSKAVGIVYLDSKKQPLEMFFDDSKLSFTGKVIEQNCNN